MFRRRVGALAGILALSVPSFVVLARSARLDALLTLFVVVAFAAAWRIDRHLGSERTNRILLHAAMGLGVATKGPVAILFPALGVLAWLTWEGRLAAFRRFVSPAVLVLSLGPGVVWAASAVALAPGGFADEAPWNNLVGRNDPLVGPLRYYGGRRVHSLENAEDVDRFFAQGGSALVIDEKRMADLGEERSFRILGGDTIRQRRMLVLGPGEE
jgi:4-amino-4-deoxy-L-arabinose transferase-like glycosyltransferase